MIVHILALAAILGISPAQEPPFPKDVLACPKIIDAAGETSSVSDSRFTVLLFVATDCPIANRMSPELRRIFEDYSQRGVRFYRVYPGDLSTVEEVRKHGEEYSLPMNAVIDPKFEWVNLVGASVTPQAAVIDKSCRLRYRGRINDSYREHGKPRTEGFRHDLRIALDELLAGRRVSVPQTPAIGCFIGQDSG